MKSKNRHRLEHDKSRICEQIGILKNEQPRLIFNRNELLWLVTKQHGTHARANGRGRRLVSRIALWKFIIA